MPDPTFETRTVAAEFEMRDDAQTGAPILEGYASTFNEPYNMGPFWEQIDRRAFDRTLGMSPDVRLLVDHEGQPLARTKSGTLTLSVDDKGLRARAVLDPSDPDVQRLLPKMRRGDLDEMSFAFRVAGTEGDSWDYGTERTLRTIKEASLSGGDVSVVTYPANPATSVSVRSKQAAQAVYVEQMARELRSGRQFPRGEIVKLRRAVERLEAEARGLTANDTRDSLNEAVADSCKGNGWGYVIDFDEANVYYTVWSYADDDEDTFMQTYTLAADGMATLTGQPQQVRPRTLWTPVTDSDDLAPRGLPVDTARRMLAALDLNAA